MIKQESMDDCSGFFLPHHSVIKPSSSSTKLRVVFDDSAKSTSGLSVNDLMMVGYNIQDDLFSIAIRFLKHKIVISADIAKMYRQIVINKKQHTFQKILLRFDPTEPLSDFKINTVTYGLACSAFLATRCLRKIADKKLASLAS
ncbi:uncharacterized protein [Diabrotica undecimpunctata]|uniref:uncharacterized protein n=1 Tax=Diabrotica undecimpunctata TaxID=50387 RepID=UPI003B63F858